MEKLVWDILVASALVITMEQFFSAFLKKKIMGYKYAGVWICVFVYHMTVMKLFNGYGGNFAGNFCGVILICRMEVSQTPPSWDIVTLKLKKRRFCPRRLPLS